MQSEPMTHLQTIDSSIQDLVHATADLATTAPAGGEGVVSHNISDKEILTSLDERAVPVVTGEGVANVRNIGEATISTNYKKDTLFPTPT